MNHNPEFTPSARLLLGPGPSGVHPRVLNAMSYPLWGYLDPQYLQVMDEVQKLLRYVFETENQLTLPVSGTGSAAMEAALCNFIEPGDEIVIGVNGYFSERMCEISRRYGAEVRRLEKDWGDVFSLAEVEAELKKRPAKILALVHAETSTGALQPIAGMGDLAHRYGALFLIDCVTSLGGVPVKIDEQGVDIAYSASQKCLSCPPGLGPITVSDRAWEALQQRKTLVRNWYLDLTLIGRYWGEERSYHHTGPISMNFALREALRLVQEEGLQNSFRRHSENAQLLWAGLEDLGLKPHVSPDHRLPSLTTVRVPDGVNEAAIRRQLLQDHNIEIAGGFGDLAGRIWRIGLMGFSSQEENISILLAALQKLLN